jgi:2-polyprenyl-3-methyl-5-hydroxy-6-metoxy-1,4-benzoquinol methylase
MPSINFYNQNAETLFKAYESINPAILFSEISQYIPKNASCLDIGCGSGRDAHWLETLGNDVTAIDPAEELIKLAQAKHGNTIKWIVSSLPNLENFNPTTKFDLILAGAIWMHIPIYFRRPSLLKMKNLLSEDGYLVLTIRNQRAEQMRTFYQSSWRRLKKDFTECGLEICHKSTSKDSLSRKGVNWLKIVLKKNATTSLL